MIKSMTGYGSAEGTGFDKKVTVEVRSVNHRYNDINIKIPRAYAYAEDEVRKVLSDFVSRGKTDVFINIESISGDIGEISVNLNVARGYYNALAVLKNEFNIKEEISLSGLTKFLDIFKIETAEEDSDGIIKLIGETAAEAAEAFTKMRLTEGDRLCEDVSGQADLLEKVVDSIEKRSPVIVSEYQKRLESRMKEILVSIPVDENRLMNEVAVFADKINVNEEIIRLRSHISQLRKFLKASEPVGRKLDFLVQELNREVNTIGSKSSDLDVARLIIDAKAIIEKIREQIQNIE